MKSKRMQWLALFVAAAICLSVLSAEVLAAGTGAAAGTPSPVHEDTASEITAFDRVEMSSLVLTEHIPLSRLLEQLPKTIEVRLKGSRASIPVQWVSDPDYSGTDEDYYLFQAQWDTDAYCLDASFDSEAYVPFVEVLIDRGTALSQQSVSDGVRNIVERAYQQVNIQWTPLKTVKGFVNSKGVLSTTFLKGTAYSGIPYGQPVKNGKYVPHDASFDEFLTAVSDAKSRFYSARGIYGSLSSTYYANDCSAFASYSYGLPRMTTSTIGSSVKFVAVSKNSLSNAQVGDCLNKSGSHVVLITGINRNESGAIVSLEISEQTPPKARTVVYTKEKVQKMLQSGYRLLRFVDRNKVAPPNSYQGYASNTVAPPETASLFLNKFTYSVDETIFVSIHAEGAENCTLVIEQAETNRVITREMKEIDSFPASELGAGSYSAHVTAQNSAGSVDSEPVSFTVYAPHTEHVWDAGSVTKEPTQTEEGTRTFTCTVCGETRTEPIPVLESPLASTPTLSTTKNLKVTLKKTTAKASWKRNNDGKGYELQYSTSERFSGAKTVMIEKNKTVKVRIRKLKKGKIYCFRIRTVKGTLCSDWSAVRKVTVKK